LEPAWLFVSLLAACGKEEAGYKALSRTLFGEGSEKDKKRSSQGASTETSDRSFRERIEWSDIR
jgi:hypothetical protein